MHQDEKSLDSADTPFIHRISGWLVNTDNQPERLRYPADLRAVFNRGSGLQPG